MTPLRHRPSLTTTVSREHYEDFKNITYYLNRRQSTVAEDMIDKLKEEFKADPANKKHFDRDGNIKPRPKRM